MERRVGVPFAAWRHREGRDGFEVVFRRAADDGERFEGHTSAVEDGRAWSVVYETRLDAEWRTRAATVTARSAVGLRTVVLETDGLGKWLVDGAPAPILDGCLDVDLESSVLTNAFPVHRLGLAVGDGAEAPAAYVRAQDAAVERLEQRYVRAPDDRVRERYDYAAPAFGVACRLVYDEHGLVLDYPGLAVRSA